ncbi:MAG TPA: succinylglutamate desuccinylase/aspartoacylase family protein [Gemmatimonadaceae bacterium]|nr:succinylglutamate desuccinylase/aspartoacylase family protein [Gemmatimonadaceae bacterium]
MPRPSCAAFHFPIVAMRRFVPLAFALLAPAYLAAQQPTLASDGGATFTVGTATATRGTSATGEIVVPAGADSGLRIPVAVFHGARPGPVVAFVAGSHGTEYASIVAMQRLLPRLDARRLAGTVIVAPLINVASTQQMTPHLNPVDRKSMNGNYPGDSTGTQTQRALAAVTREIVAPADVIVDLHGGDLDEDLRPYSYWFRSGNAAQDSASRRLVLAFGLDHVIVDDVDPAAPSTGRSLSGQSLVRGKTVLVAEAGRSGVVTPADVASLVNGSLNVLGALRMIDRPVRPLRNPVWLGGGVRVAADSAGMFFATVGRDARVAKGAVVGYTTDYLGRRTGDVRAPIAGLVTFIRGVPSTWPRAALVNIAPVLANPPAWSKPTS